MRVKMKRKKLSRMSRLRALGCQQTLGEETTSRISNLSFEKMLASPGAPFLISLAKPSLGSYS